MSKEFSAIYKFAEHMSKNDINPVVECNDVTTLDNLSNVSILVLDFDKFANNEIDPKLETKIKANNFALLFNNKPQNFNMLPNQQLTGLTYKYNSENKDVILTIAGKNVNRNVVYPIKKCLAIIHSYNVDDIIEQTIDYLFKNDIDVYVLDNWSTDKTYDIVNKLQIINPTKLYLVKYPEKPTDQYEWTKQLQQTEQLASKLNYDWYLHYDSDEFINSPFPELTLQKALSFIDYLGYNCVSKTILDFRFTKCQSIISNPVAENKLFEFGKRTGHQFDQQIKIWKNIGTNIDLSSTGGHQVKFANIERKCYPLMFRTDHYQFRSQIQMKTKLDDIVKRTEKERSEKGWHGHNLLYLDKMKGFDREDLLCFDKNATSYYFIEFLSRIDL